MVLSEKVRVFFAYSEKSGAAQLKIKQKIEYGASALIVTRECTLITLTRISG